MNIKDKLMEDFKQALKSGDNLKKNTVQLLRAAILTEEKNKQISLSDKQIEDILAKERKKRQDAQIQFEQANRQDLVMQTQKEIIIISQYLPQPLTEAELKDIIQDVINNNNYTSKDIGILIRRVKEQYGNRADGRFISIIANELLKK